MKTVWIYVDTSKQVGDRDHLKVFVNSDLADEWFLVNDPEGVVFEYEVIGAWMTKPGEAADGIARPKLIITETPCCRQWFDMRGLRQVFEHVHDARDLDHPKVFLTTDAAEKWVEENDTELFLDRLNAFV